jgi:hypothetical protein
MLDRTVRTVGIAIFLVCLIGPGTALATLKCQCNNGTIRHAMNAEYGDDDADDSCNDACDGSGGGRAWQLNQDREFIDNSNSDSGDRGDRYHKKRTSN